MGLQIQQILTQGDAHLSLSTGLSFHSALAAESPYDMCFFVNSNAVVFFVGYFYNLLNFRFCLFWVDLRLSEGAVSIKKLAAFVKRFGNWILFCPNFCNCSILCYCVPFIYIYKLGVLLGIRNYVPICNSSEWPLNDHHNFG